MTHERKTEIFKELFDSCIELQIGKAKDYASDDDALSNFKSQDAAALGLTHFQKWGVYFGKQAMSIMNAIGKSPNMPSTISEPIEERIQDAIDYNKLQREARIVFSDSGSVSEESIILGFPAITIRDSMERPEALEAGSILMSGISSAGIMEAIDILESGVISKSAPSEYLIPDSSTRVVNFIASTVHQHSFWSGLRKE